MSNMIQNITQNISSVNNTTRKYYHDFSDVNSDSLMKPLDGKGYLVENNLLTAPKELAKDTYYTAKALKKGIAGTANDHELGKLNDLGLKVGGLSIATYLMTKRSTPKTKAMEFVGFGTFLASMALWPKIALQWPARLVHGFNFRKQYVDDQGRKKFVTQDPNYIPFDLYKGDKKSENLDVIGDRMGISKGQKDRNDVVKEQMRKISVQNNTLWMLTAGPATPIMTALACNFLERPIGKWAENYSNKKANKLAEDINVYLNGKPDETVSNRVINNNIDEASKKHLEDVLTTLKGKPVNEKDIQRVSEALTVGLDAKTQKIAYRDLSYMFPQDNTIVNKNTVLNLTENLTEKLDSRYGEGFTASIIDSKKLNEHVNKFMETNGNPANGILSPEKSDELRTSLGQFIQDATEGNESVRPARKKVIKSVSTEAIDEVFSKHKTAVMTENTATYISKAGGILRRYRAFDETLSNVAHFKVENASETIAANNWDDVTKTLIKELNISNNELNEARGSEELTAKLFTRKLEALVKDESKYQEAVSKIAKKMLELDVKLDNPQEGKKAVMDVLVDGIAKNCDNTASELNSITGTESKPFFNLANRFNTKPINDTYVGTIKEAKIRRIKQARVGSIQNSYYRLLHTMDFFRRADEYANAKGGFSGDKALDNELIAKGKKLLVSSHSGDFYSKFQTAGNVDFYKALMWHTFGSDSMSPSTLKALSKEGHQVFADGKKTSLAQRVRNWAINMKDLMGAHKNDFLPSHIEGTSLAKDIDKTANAKFHNIACTPENLLHNALKQKYNSRKWMKIFSIAGASLLAGTVAAQFAFGRKDNTIEKA